VRPNHAAATAGKKNPVFLVDLHAVDLLTVCITIDLLLCNNDCVGLVTDVKTAVVQDKTVLGYF
jgi:hypothetical protein